MIWASYLWKFCSLKKALSITWVVFCSFLRSYIYYAASISVGCHFSDNGNSHLLIFSCHSAHFSPLLFSLCWENKDPCEPSYHYIAAVKYILFLVQHSVQIIVISYHVWLFTTYQTLSWVESKLFPHFHSYGTNVIYFYHCKDWYTPRN